MIAALQMYDWPEVQGRTDAFWTRIQRGLLDAGIDAPTALSRPENNHSPWTRTDLVLGQTCGLPLVLGLAGDAVVVGRPSYGLPKARDGNYCSALVCRIDAPLGLADFQGGRAAVNDFKSQSGCNALAAEVIDLAGDQPFFDQVVVSGSHRQSAIAVAESRADIAAIDAVAWALFEELEPEHHAKLRVLAWTAETPILPYITAAGHADRAEALLQALHNAAAQTGPSEIGLPRAILPADAADYRPIREMADRTRGMVLAPEAPPLWVNT